MTDLVTPSDNPSGKPSNRPSVKPSGKPSEFSPAYTRYALGLLLAVATFNLIDRSVVNLLRVPVAAELDLRDWQLGVFTGPAFGLFYALSQIPIARLAHRGKRARLIAFALAFWSVMTMLQSAAVGFLSLALARAAVAMGDAGSCPWRRYRLVDRRLGPRAVWLAQRIADRRHARCAVGSAGAAHAARTHARLLDDHGCATTQRHGC